MEIVASAGHGCNLSVCAEVYYLVELDAMSIKSNAHLSVSTV